MYVRDINPHIRFATAMRYEINYNHRTITVADCRIFYVTEGSAQLQINGIEYTLNPNSLFYCCAGSQYSVHTQEGFRLLCFNFDLTQDYYSIAHPIPPGSNPASMTNFTIHWNDVSDSSFLSGHLYLENASDLKVQLENIIETINSIDPFAQQYASAKLKLFLLQLHAKQPKDAAQKITLIKNYIQQNYAKRITNQELATFVGYHQYHLNRIFKQHTGISMHEYLLKTRLSRANYLILNSDLSLQEIAEAAGFVSYAHFSDYYKQTYGLSPMQYRKQIKQQI